MKCPSTNNSGTKWETDDSIAGITLATCLVSYDNVELLKTRKGKGQALERENRKLKASSVRPGKKRAEDKRAC